jgi:hypothetical protein
VTLEKWFVLPLVLHFFVVFMLGAAMGRARFKAAGSGRVKQADILNNSRNWPDDVLKFGNNFTNQFEIPVIWYALTLLALVTNTVNATLVVFSWLFLVFRLAHTIEHIGPNTLPRRFYFYLGGFLSLAAMWTWFAICYFVLA